MQILGEIVNFIQRKSENLQNQNIMKDETLVVLEEYNTLTEAQIAKSILESAGIEAMIRNEHMAMNFPLATPAQLVVSDADYEQAKALLHHR